MLYCDRSRRKASKRSPKPIKPSGWQVVGRTTHTRAPPTTAKAARSHRSPRGRRRDCWPWLASCRTGGSSGILSGLAASPRAGTAPSTCPRPSPAGAPGRQTGRGAEVSSERKAREHETPPSGAFQARHRMEEQPGSISSARSIPFC